MPKTNKSFQTNFSLKLSQWYFWCRFKKFSHRWFINFGSFGNERVYIMQKIQGMGTQFQNLTNLKFKSKGISSTIYF